jgi:site-specific DNA-methyltransferase (adenine-specific)
VKTQILNGDCIEMMKTLPDQSVNCCVTSPPYFGLRDYGHEGQIGLEETPEAFVQKMVEVFREVKRVLRDDGTLWLNIGDSYSNAGTRQGDRDGGVAIGTNEHRKVKGGYMPRVPGMKNKDLIGIPWMLAFALRADGWYLRQDIIWHKPNPMPESVTDRCTKAHEYIFMLSKSPRYFFDHEAIKEDAVGKPHSPGNKNVTQPKEKGARDPGLEPDRVWASDGKRNKRSVWTVTTKPYAGAHFATFPPELIRPCILAGCPKGGVVLDPFGGSGTTAAVANEENRNAILCELNPDYIPLINERINAVEPKLL